MEAGLDELGLPRPTFGRTANVGHDFTRLPEPGNWPELPLVASPDQNDGAVLVLHPWTCVTFFTAVPASLAPDEVRRRVDGEAALVVGTSDHIVEQEYVRSGVLAGERVDHLFVTCVSSSVRELFPRLSERSVQIRSSLSAVAGVMTDGSDRGGLRLALGWYRQHLEVTVVLRTEWLFGGYTTYRDPHDCLYYLASLLDRIEVNTLDIEKIYQYGSSIESAPDGPLSQLFAANLEVLRPARVFPESSETFLSQPAFVPCAGAVLKQLYAGV